MTQPSSFSVIPRRLGPKEVLRVELSSRHPRIFADFSRERERDREGIRGISEMARGRGEADVGGDGDGAAGQGEGGGQKVRIEFRRNKKDIPLDFA